MLHLALSRTILSVYSVFRNSYMNSTNVVDIEKDKEIKKTGKYRRRYMWGGGEEDKSVRTGEVQGTGN